MLYMLDTDVASYVIKARARAVEARLAGISPSSVCVSVITKSELLYGLKRLPPDHLLHAAVRRFLRIVRVLPWDEDAAALYAEIRNDLATTGQLIGEMDMMIAAHALSAGAVLATNNTRHFKRIAAPLMMVNWIDA